MELPKNVENTITGTMAIFTAFEQRSGATGRETRAILTLAVVLALEISKLANTVSFIGTRGPR